MKADREDAPVHLRDRQRKRSTWTVLIGGLVGISITAVFLYAASKQPLFMALLDPPLSPAEQAQHRIIRAPAPPDPAPYKPTAQFLPSVKQQIREQIQPPAQTKPHRQTDFSDANYMPREAENVVRFRVPQQVANSAERVEPTKVVIVRQKPSNKDMGCWPWKDGSVEERNCRFRIGLLRRD